MELDELKKSWNILDEQLQKKPIADKKQITELISAYKASTSKSLGRIVGLQRFSIASGIIALITIILTWCFTNNEHTLNKLTALLLFIAVSIIAGMWWDWKTYSATKNIRIDEMSVAEVSRKITLFRQWAKYEVIAISIWIIILNILNYWVMNYYLLPWSTQIVLITFFVIIDALIIYILYKRIIYKHLNNINKNIEELKDICTE